VLRMNRKSVNSLSLEMLTQFTIALDKLESNKNCNGLIITSVRLHVDFSELYMNAVSLNVREVGCFVLSRQNVKICPSYFLVDSMLRLCSLGELKSKSCVFIVILRINM
jgi:hypothetical protein